VKLISYRHDGAEKYGVVRDDGVVDMSARFGARYPTLRDAIAGLALDDIARQAEGASPDVALTEVEHMIPITAPDKILCVGRNYRAYHEVMQDGGPKKYPSIFPRFPSSFAAHGGAILKPRVSDTLDFEGELVAVIGKSGRHIPEDRAMEHVVGYTIMNEGSVREWQRYGTQNCPGKNFYQSGAIGPWMVTADELPDLSKVPIQTRVNGETRQDGATDMMIFSLPYVIAHVSKFTWLEPGDMIATGSPGGSAVEEDEPRWLKPGDGIEIEIPPIGVLKNAIEAE
jgi:2-keto-4-pentenoate hydratase/2-oxohepta-3-ene-1,7-dioic acid hydratase in catechol pathway